MVVVFFLFGLYYIIGVVLPGPARVHLCCSVLLVWSVLFCCVRCCPYARSTIYVLLLAWGPGV